MECDAEILSYQYPVLMLALARRPVENADAHCARAWSLPLAKALRVVWGAVDAMEAAL